MITRLVSRKWNQLLLWLAQRFVDRMDEECRLAAMLGMNHDPEIRADLDYWYARRKYYLKQIKKLKERGK